MSPVIEPVDFDRDTGPFFRAAIDGRLIFRFCRACRRGFQVPAQHCRHCGSADTEWRDAQGTGTLYTWTTVRQQVHEAYPVPYTVVVVALDEAPHARFVGSIPGEPQLTAGQPMQVWFQALAPGVVLPNWRQREADQ
jgi:uncharacterized OB-fold protein